jgi:hypothetical protein
MRITTPGEEDWPERGGGGGPSLMMNLRRGAPGDEL